MNSRYFLAASASLFLFNLPALAQLGVSPSQNGLWFQEWQDRWSSSSASEAAEAPLGRVGDPDFLNVSQSGALRLQGDLTGYHHQFQHERRFLNVEPRLGGQGLASQQPFTGSLEQSFEWNYAWNEEAMFSTTALSLRGQYGTLDTGRLTLDLAGGITQSLTDDLSLPSSGGDTAWFVQPGSSLVYEQRFGDVTVGVYDRFSARPESTRGRGFYQRGTVWAPFFAAMQNDLGAVLTWQPLDDLELTVNYNWASSQAIQNASVSWFDPWSDYPLNNLDALADRDIHSVQASLSWKACSAASLGVRGGYSWTQYEENFANDGQQWNVGLFADVSLPLKQRLSVEVGAQGMSFEDPQSIVFASLPLDPTPTPDPVTNADPSDLNATPYVHLSLGGQLGPRFSHQLSLGRESALGLLSNYVETYYANYGVQAKLWKGAAVNLSGFFEDLQDSGGRFAQDTEVFGGSLLIQQKWRYLTLTAGYAYTQFRALADPHRSFPPSGSSRQHVIQAGATCQLTPMSSLNLSWQRFEIESSSFTQDRLSLGLRVQF